MAILKSKVNAVTLHDPRKRVTTTYASFKGGKDYCGKENIIDTVLKAIELSLPCTVTYRAANSGEAKTYEIEPYTFVDHGNALYCIAAIPAHNRDIRVLAIERIEKITHHADRSFAIKDGYDPEEYLGASFGIIVEDPVRVRVRFTADAAFYARERVWGQEQTVEEEADGSIILSFTASGLMEIKRWALSFGSAARVLEPENLAASVAAEAEALVAAYKKK
jgi:proteasome accessory factor B